MIKMGDRVERDETNLGWPYSGKILHGVVTRVYTNTYKDYGSGPVHYPVLYGVTWDNYRYKEGHLPHGIYLEGSRK